MAKKKAKLTNKQQVFVEHYLRSWNAAKAARLAGYSEKTAQEQGSRLLSNAMVSQVIEERLGRFGMKTNEVLARLADHARGSLEMVLDDDNDISLATARENGKLHLIKKLKRSTRTDKDGAVTHTVELELHDPQTALVHIGRALKLFVDKIALTDPSGENEYKGFTDEELRAIANSGRGAGHPG